MSDSTAILQELQAIRHQLAVIDTKLGERFLNRHQVADLLGVSLRTVDRMRKRGKLVAVDGVPGVKFDPRTLPKMR